MAKKKKKEEPEKAYKDERTTIYASSKIPWKTFEENRLFAILVMCGYPASKAYRIAFDTKASANSSASLACRKLQDKEVQFILSMISHSYWGGSIRLNDKYCKEGRKSWGPYLGRKERRLKP